MKNNPPTVTSSDAQPLAVVPHNPQPLTERQPLPSLSDVTMQLIEKATTAGAAVEVIKELRAMRAEDLAIEARRAFDFAFAAFQAECPVITKAKDVVVDGKRAYSYSPLEDIIAQVQPLLDRHGFNFKFDTDVESKDGWVIAKCIVTHRMGETRVSTAKFPLGGGTRLMSTTQIFSSALTFANRRVFCNAFGIVTAGEDMDGRIKQKPKGPSTLDGDTNVRALARELWLALPAEVAGKNPNWGAAKQFLVDENIISPEEHGGDTFAPTWSPDRFRAIINAVKAKK